MIKTHPGLVLKYTVAPAFLASLAILGYSVSFHAWTLPGSDCATRQIGRCGDNPILRNNLPVADSDNSTPNSRRINFHTMSLVHNAKSNANCLGSLPVTHSETCWCCFAVNFGGRPGIGLATNASQPPWRAWTTQP